MIVEVQRGVLLKIPVLRELPARLIAFGVRRARIRE